MTNRPAKLSKRILAALLDLIIIYMCVMVVSLLITSSPLGAGYNETYEKYTSLYNSYALKHSIGTLSTLSNNSITVSIFQQTSSNAALFSNFTSAALADSNFVDIMNKTMNYYLIILICSVTIVEAIFLLLIPMLSKKGQTVGKLIMGLGVIDVRYDMFLSNKNKLIRFAMGFGVETILIMILFKDQPEMVIFFSPIIVLLTIMISQHKQALHDVVSHAKVVELNVATIFNSIEEKEAYDASLANKNENVIDAEIEEEEENIDFSEEVNESIEEDNKSEE